MLDLSGQTISPVGQRDGEPAVRVRANHGTETGRALDNNRRAGQGMASHVAKRPLDSAGIQLREQCSMNENQSRQERPKPDFWQTKATAAKQ